MLGWLSRESLPTGLSLRWVCKALMGKFNASFRKSIDTALVNMAWSPTNFHTLKMVWRKIQLSSAAYCNYISSEYVCKKRQKFPGFTNCLKSSQSKKEQPWSSTFSSAQFADLHIDLESFHHSHKCSGTMAALPKEDYHSHCRLGATAHVHNKFPPILLSCLISCSDSIFGKQVLSLSYNLY